MFDPNKITYFAETDFRNRREKFGIRQEDRTRHVYCIGKTGMGKSTMLENMAVQDIQMGHGMAFMDPHGQTAELLLSYVPRERMKDVLYFAPFDLDNPISFNVMEDVGPDRRHLVANGLMSAFKKIWVDAWSARMEYILTNVLLALLEYPDSTIIGVNRMLADKTYRKHVVNNITDVSVKAFWEDEFAKYGERYMQEAGAAIQNKIGQFVSNPLVRNIIGQPKSSFDVRKIMDEQKLLIINLSKGRVGEDNANLIGSMLITKIYLAAMSRADATPQERDKLPNFYFFVDEFQSFANESFANILSEARKYKLNLTIAHQYIEQMTDEVRAAVFGNVGSMITFRVGATDAEVFEKEFAPEFTAQDLVNLGKYQVYLRLMIDGVGSKPFSARTLPPVPHAEDASMEEIIASSREQFARPRSVVEEEIIRWHQSSAGLLNDPHLKNKDNNSNQSRGDDRSPSRSNENSSKKERSPRKNFSNNKSFDRRGNSNNQGRNEERESRLQQAISLQQLADKSSKKKPKEKPKQPSSTNMQSLKDALSSVLKGVTQTEDKGKKEDVPKPDEKKPETAPKQEKREEKGAQEKKEQGKSPEQVNQKAPDDSISPEELKKMLEV